MEHPKTLRGSAEALAFAKTLFSPEKPEFYALYIKRSTDEVLSMENLSDDFSVRRIFERAFAHKADGILLFHNHDDNDSFPSSKDEELTGIIMIMAEFLGMQLLEHIIIGADGNGTLVLDFMANEGRRDLSRMAAALLPAIRKGEAN